MLDVDHFKQFNDRYGHPAGDAMLRHGAGALQHNARAQDFVARYGGEEFSVILPSTGREAALAIAKRLRHLVSGLAQPTPVTVSIGIISGLPGALPEVVRMAYPYALVKAADAALYQAKNPGVQAEFSVCQQPPGLAETNKRALLFYQRTGFAAKVRCAGRRQAGQGQAAWTNGQRFIDYCPIHPWLDAD